MKNNFTAFATLSDNTIITLIVTIDDKKVYLAVTILDRGFYVSSKQYTKTLDITELDIKDLIENEIKSNDKGLSYSIIYNF